MIIYVRHFPLDGISPFGRRIRNESRIHVSPLHSVAKSPAKINKKRVGSIELPTQRSSRQRRSFAIALCAIGQQPFSQITHREACARKRRVIASAARGCRRCALPVRLCGGFALRLVSRGNEAPSPRGAVRLSCCRLLSQMDRVRERRRHETCCTDAGARARGAGVRGCSFDCAVRGARACDGVCGCR